MKLCEFRNTVVDKEFFIYFGVIEQNIVQILQYVFYKFEIAKRNDIVI